MRTLAAIAFATLLATGGAVAQDSGSGGESGPGGQSTGREVGAMPTVEDCERGWDPSMRVTEAEFNIACENK